MARRAVSGIVEENGIQFLGSLTNDEIADELSR